MSRQPIILRPGNPTLEEGLACARLLDMAAEGFFGILHGRRAPEIFAQAYVKSRNEYSFENVVFAESEERIVGMALGFTTEQRRGFPKNSLKESDGYPRLRAGILRFFARPMIRILETLADGDFYLLSLAVNEDQRGQGIGSALIEAMQERARTTGSRRFVLDAAAKNAAGQRLYKRHGFEIYAKWPKFLHSKRFGLVRMAKLL